MRLFFWCALLSVSLVMWWATRALTDPAEKYPWLDLYLEDDALVWTAPERINPKNIHLAPRDITYRKKVLPYEEDRYADIYMVIPQLWLITPIQQIPPDSADRNSMVDGREIGLNKYLQGWIIEYVGSVPPWHRGKRIDFWHSNYFARDAGRYKTIFANLMWLDPNDEIWYFVRDGDQYILHRYLVTASYPTKPSDVQALHRDGDGADALIFGCYHWLDGRWMVEATAIDDPEMPLSEQEVDEFADLSSDIRYRLDSTLADLAQMASKWRKAEIAALYTRLTKYQETYQLTAQETLIVSYLIAWFSKLYE